MKKVEREGIRVTDTQKAWIFWNSLPPDLNSQVLEELSDDAKEAMVADLQAGSSAEVSSQVVAEFWGETGAPKVRFGDSQRRLTGLLARLRPRELLSLLVGEKPDTIAALLSYQEPDHASLVLGELDPPVRIAAAGSLAEMGKLAPKNIAEQLSRTWLSEHGLDQTQKASILVLSLAPDVSALVFKELGSAQVQAIAGAIAKLPSVDSALRQAVQDEFLSQFGRSLDGTLDQLASKHSKEMAAFLRQYWIDEVPMASKGCLLGWFLPKKVPDTPETPGPDLTPNQKALILCSSLPTEVEAQVRRELGPVKEPLGELLPERREQVTAEFWRASGGLTFPFGEPLRLAIDFLARLDSKVLLRFLGCEETDTMAAVLSYLPPEQRNEVLAQLGNRDEVSRTLVDIERTSPAGIARKLMSNWLSAAS